MSRHSNQIGKRKQLGKQPERPENATESSRELWCIVDWDLVSVVTLQEKVTIQNHNHWKLVMRKQDSERFAGYIPTQLQEALDVQEIAGCHGIRSGSQCMMGFPQWILGLSRILLQLVGEPVGVDWGSANHILTCPQKPMLSQHMIMTFPFCYSKKVSILTMPVPQTLPPSLPVSDPTFLNLGHWYWEGLCDGLRIPGGSRIRIWLDLRTSRFTTYIHLQILCFRVKNTLFQSLVASENKQLPDLPDTSTYFVWEQPV